MSHKISVQDALNDRAHSYKASIGGWSDKGSRAWLSFRQIVNGNPRPTNTLYLNDIAESSFLDPLEITRDLEIDISTGNDPVSVCAVQDVLFAFVDRIPPDHRLRSLSIRITIILPNDPNERQMTTADVWAGFRIKKDIIHENKYIQPGELSRMHMTAFLTDPIRKIRNLNAGERGGKFSITFPGHTGVWKDIAITVEELVRSNAEVKDYEAFRKYFKALRPFVDDFRKGLEALAATKNVNRGIGNMMTPPITPESNPAAHRGRKKVVVDLTGDEVIDFTTETDQQEFTQLGQGHERSAPSARPEDPVSELEATMQAFASARIRGHFHDLNIAHIEILNLAADPFDDLEKKAETIPERQIEFKKLRKRLLNTCEALDRAWYEKVDVSHYGYNEADKRLGLRKTEPKTHAPAKKPQVKQKKRKRPDKPERDGQQDSETPRPTRTRRTL